MSRQFLGKTTGHDVVALMAQGQRVIEYWPDFCRLLTQHFGVEGTSLLAEPAFHDNGSIDWYGETGTPIPQDELLAQYEAIKTKIEALGAHPEKATTDTDRTFLSLLLFAIQIPSPDYLRSGPNGPVLIGWGHQPVTTRIEQVDLKGFGKRPPPRPKADPPASETKTAAQPPVTILPPPPEPPVMRLWGPWQSWLQLFAKLAGLACILWLLSRLGGWIGSWICHYPNFPLWITLPLVLLIGLLLLLLLPWRTWSDFRRVGRVGAQTGILQIVLAWDDLNDLDLHVLCPDGGRIYFGNRSHGGGMLDHDANARTTGAVAPTKRAVENIVWQGAPPPGLYTVEVDPFSMPIRPHTRFRLTVRHNGHVLVARQGIVSQTRGTLSVCQFRISS